MEHKRKGKEPTTGGVSAGAGVGISHLHLPPHPFSAGLLCQRSPVYELNLTTFSKL